MRCHPLLLLCATARAASGQAVPFPNHARMDTVVIGVPIVFRTPGGRGYQHPPMVERALTYFIDAKRIFVPLRGADPRADAATAQILARLNPDNVKHMTVLKGDAAAKVGGCPDTAGVIWIETVTGNFSTRTHASGDRRVDVCPKPSPTDNP